ncbi:MAG TPA: protein kinase, partial [Thermoanaerobaculia bacterium]|nr:protein kinase [Thermoanaerobaculia bacterium]
MRDRVGSFEVVAPLGAGGMGQVYRARDPRLGRDVAVKVLSTEADPARLIRFEKEARAASALSHPNIVTVYEVGESEGVPFIAMELVEGKPLSELIATGALPVKRALELAAQIADGLGKAHESGIVHRDLKPENVMVSRDGFVKILDFGLAKLVEDDGPRPASGTGDLLTRPGTIVGTASYMSPEQTRGELVDFRSDQFAFGAVLYEMLTGKRAFSRATAVQTLTAILEDEPVPAAELNPRIPVPLRWVLDRCLAKEAEERYAATRDLAKELRTIRAHLTETATSDAAATPRVGGVSRLRLRARAIALGAACGALLGAGAALLLVRPRAPEPPSLRALTYSGRDRSPTVSRDGRLLAFTSERESPRRIWLKQLAGGDEVALTAGPDDAPRLAPDGSAVLFARENEGRPSLFRAPVVGGEARKVVSGAREGDWSPDGRRIAFVRFLSEAQRSYSTLSIATADGEGEERLATVENHQLLSPRFSPGGGFVAVTSRGLQGLTADTIEVFSVGGGRRTLAPARSFFVSSVAWDGDGALVYAYAERMTANVSGEPGRIVR